MSGIVSRIESKTSGKIYGSLKNLLSICYWKPCWQNYSLFSRRERPLLPGKYNNDYRIWWNLVIDTCEDRKSGCDNDKSRAFKTCLKAEELQFFKKKFNSRCKPFYRLSRSLLKCCLILLKLLYWTFRDCFSEQMRPTVQLLFTQTTKQFFKKGSFMSVNNVWGASLLAII